MLKVFWIRNPKYWTLLLQSREQTKGFLTHKTVPN